MCRIAVQSLPNNRARTLLTRPGGPRVVSDVPSDSAEPTDAPTRWRIDAMSHGFAPIVVSDACGDRHAAPHEANLFDMNAKYADVVDEAAVMAYLGEMAGQ